MAQSAPPPFDPNHPPVIEGFTPGALQHYEETFKDKFLRKCQENPLVPIGVTLGDLEKYSEQKKTNNIRHFILGCVGTAGVLTYGLIAFKRGNTRQSQIMMRARILAQGFTIAALMVGVVITAMKPQK